MTIKILGRAGGNADRYERICEQFIQPVGRDGSKRTDLCRGILRHRA